MRVIETDKAKASPIPILIDVDVSRDVSERS